MPEQKVKDNTQMQQELELQLHEQYASNSNATLGSMLTLFVAMLAVLGGYGYVFINSYVENGCKFLIGEEKLYTAPALLVTTAAATSVLAAIAYICIESGYKGRMEQFITFAIRKKYYNDEELAKVFPKGYSPFGKYGCWVRPMQSPYDTFLYITATAMAIINCATFVRVYCCMCCCDSQCGSTCCVSGLMFLQFSAIVAFLIAVFYRLARCYDKYKERCHEYETK